MAEPQPPNVVEGAADPPPSIPTSAEDRKAAAALDSLDARGDDEGAAPKKNIDRDALDKAMKALGADKPKPKAALEEKKEVEKKKVVKIDQADVALLVEQLDLSKTKATELLRAHDADAVKAMTAFVTAPV
ncbi:hypothetical protein LTR66_001014 [Elasticomyces elasticus]|nr:hypothetical protein LTR50_006626 [Elasticomyces elasticus]KAK5000067.1 hypothetical protein LTR66_001014 [Elasticomyces elasticus]KAK5006663.1 hypothetical protein LTR28_006220 [Elasticomyces elasticus]